MKQLSSTTSDDLELRDEVRSIEGVGRKSVDRACMDRLWTAQYFIKRDNNN